MADTFTDESGAELGRDEVEAIAFDNVMGSMSKQELAKIYVESMPDEALAQWATDEEGNFPDD